MIGLRIAPDQNISKTACQLINGHLRFAPAPTGENLKRDVVQFPTCCETFRVYD
jgi:hypothetical protein